MLSISLASLQAVNLPELFNILSALSVSAEVWSHHMCFIFKDTSLGMYDVRRYNCHPFMYLTTKLA